MKAAILFESKKPLIIADIKTPEKLEYGQVHVKVKYATLCGAQINEIEAVKGPDKYLPHLLGHEGLGTIINTGPGVSRVKKGDDVIIHWRKASGIEAPTAKYDYNGTTVNSGACTCFSEETIVSENRVTPINTEGLLLEGLPLYGCSLTTAYGMIHNNANLKIGQSLLIMGSGGLGLSIVMMAKLMNINPIVIIDKDEWKLKKAERMGAIIYYDLSKLKNDYPKGFDSVMDTTGDKKIREYAYELTNNEGTTVLAGVPHKGEVMCIDSFPLHFNKKITGSHGGDTIPDKDIPRLIELQRKGLIEPETLITHEYELKDINQAIKDLKDGNTIKCLIKMNRG